jgi:predicted PurR-regulated permease PerM
MTSRRLQAISFLVILLAVLAVILIVLRPLFEILAFAVILSILFHPAYTKIKARIKSPSWSALLTVLIMLAIIAIPVALFGQIVISELIDAYHKLTTNGNGDIRHVILQHTPAQWQAYVQAGLDNFNATLARLTSDAFSTISSILSNVAAFFVALFIIILSVFYLLRDGEGIIKILMDISPIAQNQENILFAKITLAVNGMIKGQFLVALVQGSIATVGYLIFGVPQPLLWGLATVMTALVPTVGTALSVIPAVLLLLFTGHNAAALGLAIWGALGVGTVDNLIGPRLVGSRIKLHPLLVLISIVGGLQYFGILGFLLGPILMSIFVALVDIYRTDFKDQLE